MGCWDSSYSTVCATEVTTLVLYLDSCVSFQVMIVLELMDNGDLRKHLLSLRDRLITSTGWNRTIRIKLCHNLAHRNLCAYP